MYMFQSSSVFHVDYIDILMDSTNYSFHYFDVMLANFTELKVNILNTY